MAELIIAIAIWCQKPYSGVGAFLHEDRQVEQTCRDKLFKCVDVKKPETIYACAQVTKP